MPTTSQTDTAADNEPPVERAQSRREALVAKFTSLLHEGRVRRISVQDHDGHAVIDIPVTAGLVATAIAPTLVGVAAIAALAGHWTVQIERGVLITDSEAGPSAQAS